PVKYIGPLTEVFAPTLKKLMRTEGFWSSISVLLIVGVGAWYDAALLFQTSVAVGTDGYYYVLQADQLLNQGHFFYSTNTPLILYAIAGTSALTGDTVLAIKIVAIVLHALLCLGIFALVIRITNSAWLGVIGAGLAAMLGSHIFLVTEFVKNLGALTLLVWSAWAAIKALERRRVIWTPIAIGLLVTAMFCHRSTIFVA